MKITVAAVGKAKTSPALSLYHDYTARTPWKISLVEVEEKRPLPPDLLAQKEAELLLKAIPQGARCVVLDERGKSLDSPAFARTLSSWGDQGHSSVAFLIGGAQGHGKEARDRADLLLSFGTMTWPHMMVRAMLAEQLYRAYTITSGHPYHKV
ncbi:MAG: rRNA ((1915)-N(3))-methyltransferase RlmH [Rickettsiales bacterium]|jgi:23S rRNA (pseudouridine1915-N3)-methyltransferase|nr:rRNA ((1915)-N(3))-methyltransferase RlmH [Rickettsiales bacterium]